ncbi:BGTF surface domain-containing protein, partial [Haloferax sp. Atlit-109R]|uniref:BGTF surface domain-containing protein n=1 Tax=Haloferax sp. Atlit-109R TaxID=2282134 RepID=UPI0031835F47
LEPGTNVSLRVVSGDDTEPRFLKTTETTVGEDGNFSAAFNFSEAPDGGTFTVTAEILLPSTDDDQVESEGVVVEDTESTTTETADSTNETAAGTETT